MQATSAFGTKLAILQAIDRPVSELSVTEICDKAGVSRTTFYRHFDSKLDIVPWWGLWCSEQYTFQIGRKYSWEEGMLRNLYLFRSQMKSVTNMNDFGQGTPYFGGNPFAIRHNEVLRETARMHGVEVTPLLGACIVAFCHLESELTYAYCEEGLKHTVLEDTQIGVSVVPPLVYEACQLPAVAGESREERFEKLPKLDRELHESGDLEESFMQVIAQGLGFSQA